MSIKPNTDIFVLRFADKEKMNTIEEHLKLLNSNGHVWFGKIGITPLKSYLDTQLKNGKMFILLTKPGKYYIAECDKFSFEKPNEDYYPQYYREGKFINFKFSSWYRLTKIKEVPNRIVLESIIIKSSGSYLRSALQGSMSPMFKAITVEEIDY